MNPVGTKGERRRKVWTTTTHQGAGHKTQGKDGEEGRGSGDGTPKRDP